MAAGWTERVWARQEGRLSRVPPWPPPQPVEEPTRVDDTTWKVMSQISDTLKNSCFEIKGLRKQH
jgi:hypothetical protein